MLRVWNVTLVILTFLLTIFGTFMTRSGVVQSVHAFGEDPDLAMMFTVFMVAIATVLVRVRHLPPAAAAGTQRARLVGVARGGVPREQLDSAVLRDLRPLRHDVPDAERGADGRAAHGRSAVLQQVDAADRPRSADADGHRAAARMAQVDAEQPATPVPVARHGRPRHRRHDGRAGRAACGRRVCASRCAASSRRRCCRSSIAGRACGSRRDRDRSADGASSGSSRARAAATAATSCTSASCSCSSASRARASSAKSRWS